MNKSVKTFVFSLGCLGSLYTANAQSKEDVKLGVGVHGVELSVNKKLYERFYLEGYVGIGGGNEVRDGFSYTLNWKHLVPYTKGVVKWNYVDLDRKRNFVSLQAKYTFGHADYYDLNRVLLTEINWGIERHFTKDFLFHVHVGMGHVKDFDSEESRIIPTIGVSLKYRLFSL